VLLRLHGRMISNSHRPATARDAQDAREPRSPQGRRRGKLVALP
jgi:hypothetical protein